MNFDKKTKKTLTLAVVAVVLVGLFGSMLQSGIVLSVDRIWLYQRGLEGGDGELKDGIWRITATSADTKVQFLQLNQETMEANQEYGGDFPDDVEVNGDIYVEVSQPYSPYWSIPITDLGQVQVVPEMQGVKLGGTRGGVTADAVSAHLWGLNLAAKKVVIPFQIVVAKVAGENIGVLVTDDNRVKMVSGDYPTYQISISQSDIINGEASKIVFYNPEDSQEKLTLNLQWSFGDYDAYSWDYDLLFITPEDGYENKIPTFEMTFLAADKQAIMDQLNYQSSSDWTFCRYWYGGGNVFKGTKVTQALTGLNEASGKFIEQNGVSTGLVQIYDGEQSYLITEGYTSPFLAWDGKRETKIYQFGGWYTPVTGTPELPENTVQPADWDYWRYPLTPNLNSDPECVLPRWSVLNYLASNFKAYVTGYEHSPFTRVNPDVWGYGVGGNIGVNGQIGVVLPSYSRQWLFTLDVSTELVDTVVVQEDYVNVQITQDLSLDTYTLNAGESATGTIKLKNLSPWTGLASLSISPPENLQFSCQITGTQSYNFGIDEEKTVQITIKNTGLLNEELSGIFRLSVKNQQPYETDSQTFTMTFKPGIGVPNSLVDVTTRDADGGAKVSGITIKAVYGVDGESSRTASTVNGECTLDLGKYEGPVTLSAVDYQGRYEGEETVVNVGPGSTAVAFNLIKLGSGTTVFDWTWITVAAIASVTVVAVFIMWRKK